MMSNAPLATSSRSWRIVYGFWSAWVKAHRNLSVIQKMLCVPVIKELFCTTHSFCTGLVVLMGIASHHTYQYKHHCYFSVWQPPQPLFRCFIVINNGSNCSHNFQLCWLYCLRFCRLCVCQPNSCISPVGG